jgi:hypothetical protein
MPCTGFAFKSRFATFMHTTNLKQILTYLHCFDNNLSSFVSKSKLKNLHSLLHVKFMSVFKKLFLVMLLFKNPHNLRIVNIYFHE